jgi:mono/diheme cytochrome c family protein
VRQRRPRHLPRRSRPHDARYNPFVTTLALVATLGCGGGDERVTETADSAVAYGAAPFDSGRIDSSSGSVDTASADSVEAVGGLGPAEPQFVLTADSARGREIYNGAGTCFTCHALDGAGVDPLGSSLRDSAWTHIDGSLPAIARVIRDGIPVSSSTRRGMPAFGTRLSDEELYRLAAYTYTLSHPGSAVADTASVDSAASTLEDTSGTPR